MDLLRRRSRFCAKNDWLRIACPFLKKFGVRIRVKRFPHIPPDVKMETRDILLCLPAMEHFNAAELAESEEALYIFDNKKMAIAFVKNVLEKKRGFNRLIAAGARCYLEAIRLRGDGSGIKDFPDMESSCFEGAEQEQHRPANGEEL